MPCWLFESARLWRLKLPRCRSALKLRQVGLQTNIRYKTALANCWRILQPHIQRRLPHRSRIPNELKRFPAKVVLSRGWQYRAERGATMSRRSWNSNRKGLFETFAVMAAWVRAAQSFVNSPEKSRTERKLWSPNNMSNPSNVALRLLPLGALLFVAACNGNPIGGTATSAPGSTSTSVAGLINSETRTISDVSAVSLETSGDLSISVTGVESLTIEAEANILPLLTSDVSSNRLTLSTKSNSNVQTSQPIRYTLTVKDLKEVVTDGSGKITINALAANNLGVAINGSGSVTLNGKADALAITVSGSGDFDGGKLASKTAMVNDSGSGNVLIQVSDMLNATLSGSGSVRYIGNPTVNSTLNGSGSVGKQQ